MIDAAKATEQTLLSIRKKEEVELEQIEELIIGATKRGLFSVWYYDIICEKIKFVLESLGYYVSKPNSQNRIKISWGSDIKEECRNENV